MQMSEQAVGAGLPTHGKDDRVLPVPRGADQPRRRATDKIGPEAAALTRFEQEQLAREFADIERASAALRLGEPGLQSWTRPTVPAVIQKPRPLWLLIGILWLSTALVAAGAVVAIAKLTG
jgi:hypothetical protein